MEKEQRERFELYRTIAVLSDYFDKNSRFMVITFAGILLITVPLSTYISTILTLDIGVASLFAILISVYGGLLLFAYGSRYQKRAKRKFDTYLDMVLRDKLISETEYSELLSNLRNELAHSIESASEMYYVADENGIARPVVVEKKDYEFIKRKKELDLLEKEIKDASERKFDLLDNMKNLESEIAMLETKIYDIKKATTPQKKHKSE